MLVWFSTAFADPLVAVVLIDEAARNEGYALELEDLVVDDALPIDVAAGEHVRIVDPDGQRFEIDVAPGEAWEVTGPGAEAWMSRIGEDVRSDVLVVRGDADAVLSLAQSLHAEIRHERGQTLLLREGILFAAPWAEMRGVDRLDEVSLVPVDAPAVSQTGAAPARRVAPARRIRKNPVRAVAPVAPITPSAPVLSTIPAVVAPRAADAPPAVPAAPAEPTAAAVTDETDAPKPMDDRSPLDPTRYLGVWLCGDGNVAVLSPGGFAAGGANGTWRVSSPGVIRLEVRGALFGRVAFGEEGSCRAVWRS